MYLAEVVYDKDGTLVVKSKNIPTNLLNEIRRFCLSEVETISIEDVNFIENTSILSDEMVAHRLGLLPLKQTGNETSDINYILNQVNNTNRVKIVFSDHLKTNGEIVPISGIPITKLYPGESIKLTCITKKGQGKTHSKYCPFSSSIVVKVKDLNFLKLESDYMDPRSVLNQVITDMKLNIKLN